MPEGKPFCGRCMTTHFVEQACKAEDLAKLVGVAPAALLPPLHPGTWFPAIQTVERPSGIPVERRQGNPRSGPPGASRRGGDQLPQDEPGYPGVERDGGEQPPKTTAPAKFDRAAYMRDRHAKRKG